MSFGNSLAGTYTNLIIGGLLSLPVVFILIVEMRQFYLSYREKVALELRNNTMNTSDASGNSSASPSGSPATHIDVQMSIDLGDISKESTKEATETTTSTAATRAPEPIRPTLMILSCCIYLFNILSPWVYILTTMENVLNLNCGGVAFAGLFFMTGKCFLYLTFIYRLYFVYSNSVFQYSTRTLLIMAVFCVIYTVFSSVANLLTKQTIILEIEGYTFCAVANNGIVILITIAYELFINILCCYWFTRPLLWFAKMQEQNKQTQDLRSVVSKYVILTSIACTTTVFTWLLLIFTGFNWVSGIDALINCVCIMFFRKCYEKYYHCICCGAHRCGSSLINKCCVTKTNNTK